MIMKNGTGKDVAYRGNGALAKEISKNLKIGIVAATYVPVRKTCPVTCPHHPDEDNSCYACHDNVGIHQRKLEEEAGQLKALAIARAEAEAIKMLSGKLPLRLHVSGDSRTKLGTKAIAQACKEYTAKHGAPVWTYTHAWDKPYSVPRAFWGSVSVLASCETVEQVKRAHSLGYAVAMSVSGHGTIDDPAIKEIPCPQQTHGIQCMDCMLCMRDQKLIPQSNGKIRVIAFDLHGAGKNKSRLKKG